MKSRKVNHALTEIFNPNIYSFKKNSLLGKENILKISLYDEDCSCQPNIKVKCGANAGENVDTIFRFKNKRHKIKKMNCWQFHPSIIQNIAFFFSLITMQVDIEYKFVRLSKLSAQMCLP